MVPAKPSVRTWRRIERLMYNGGPELWEMERSRSVKGTTSIASQKGTHCFHYNSPSFVLSPHRRRRRRGNQDWMVNFITNTPSISSVGDSVGARQAGRRLILLISESYSTVSSSLGIPLFHPLILPWSLLIYWFVSGPQPPQSCPPTIDTLILCFE